MNSVKYIKQIALSWAICISIGALGAHWLKTQLSADSLASFETGNRYHFYMNIGLILLVLLENRFEIVNFKRIFNILTIGLVLFSGSIYILATKSIHGIEAVKFLGPITPIGGLLMIASWIMLAFNIKKMK